MIRSVMIATALVFGVAVTTSGPAAMVQAPPERMAQVDVETIGPKVNTAVPDFSLPDQHGRIRSLASLMGPKGAVLVFFRSADW